jgi:hypothetical protein
LVISIKNRWLVHTKKMISLKSRVFNLVRNIACMHVACRNIACKHFLNARSIMHSLRPELLELNFTIISTISSTITPALPYNPHVLQSNHKELHRLRQHLHLLQPSHLPNFHQYHYTSSLAFPPRLPTSANIYIHPSHPLAITLLPPTSTPSLAFPRSPPATSIFLSSSQRLPTSGNIYASVPAHSLKN